MDSESHITLHNCIQGWSGIAEWTGVPMTALLDRVRPRPEARYAVFQSFNEGGEGGEYFDSHTIEDLRHAQSQLALDMNGQPLSTVHGAPVRLRVENQLGFKQVKWIRSIRFVATLDEVGQGEGGYNEFHEYFGYRAEI